LAGTASDHAIAVSGTALSAGAFLPSQFMARLRGFIPARSAGPIGPPGAIRVIIITRPLIVVAVLAREPG
jgi:hypothetical protein